jgi:hypothetical protein
LKKYILLKYKKTTALNDNHEWIYKFFNLEKK